MVSSRGILFNVLTERMAIRVTWFLYNVCLVIKALFLDTSS